MSSFIFRKTKDWNIFCRSSTIDRSQNRSHRKKNLRTRSHCWELWSSTSIKIHTSTRAHTRPRTRTHAHPPTCSTTHSNTHTYTNTHTHAHMHTHMLTHLLQLLPLPTSRVSLCNIKLLLSNLFPGSGC